MTSSANNLPGAAKVSPRAGRYNEFRTANFKRIIETLRTGAMDRAKAAEALGITLQNASKYFCDLAKHGVTEFASGPCTAFAVGRTIQHRLTGDEKAIDAFLESLDAPRECHPARSKITADPARHFHLICRDSLTFAPPAASHGADPLGLPKRFFKPKPVRGETMARFLPVIPPKPPGFPVPSNFAFQVPA